MPQPKNNYYAHGKLLLSGEYFILDGAWGVALPTHPGQHLSVTPTDNSHLEWKSLDADGTPWLEATFDLESLRFMAGTDAQIGGKLEQVLREVRHLSPRFLSEPHGYQVETRLEFSRHWGLGSSSTLLSLLSQWSGANVYTLASRTFGGSGYDLAVAQANGPILYQRMNPPLTKETSFSPPFADQLYFVYLGNKMNSREGIASYRKQGTPPDHLVERISTLSLDFLRCDDFSTFCELIETHETLVANYIGLQRAQNQHFPDFPGAIKSLGAWGGDFVLVASPESEEQTRYYFELKGYPVCLRFEELILQGTGG
jgi:mevalonate kinase